MFSILHTFDIYYYYSYIILIYSITISFYFQLISFYFQFYSIIFFYCSINLLFFYGCITAIYALYDFLVKIYGFMFYKGFCVLVKIIMIDILYVCFMIRDLLRIDLLLRIVDFAVIKLDLGMDLGMDFMLRIF